MSAIRGHFFGLLFITIRFPLLSFCSMINST
ncbi:unnamed protein product [Diabrotica balteata]|uniref:Uncharacterized protein n=1 Tax=Diabrotica balteata TaxID=107213 RepID=A0A9N9SZ24_DIABA|nr:unnamed protein product [Diabrotica balteata]